MGGEGRKEEREERREGGAKRGVLLYIYSDSNVSFAGLLSTVAPLRALRVSGILLTYLLLHPASPHFFPPISLGPRQIFTSSWSPTTPYYAIPSIIAVNMILSVAVGGTTAIVIAVWAQVWYI